MGELKEIKKELLIDMKYPTDDILIDRTKQLRRRNNLYTAMLLGNSFKRKVKILFNTVDQKFFVNTTVWSVGKEFITLKGGRIVPIRSIYKIQLY
jgi:hypothetical protein